MGGKSHFCAIICFKKVSLKAICSYKTNLCLDHSHLWAFHICLIFWSKKNIWRLEWPSRKAAVSDSDIYCIYTYICIYIADLKCRKHYNNPLQLCNVTHNPSCQRWPRPVSIMFPSFFLPPFHPASFSSFHVFPSFLQHCTCFLPSFNTIHASFIWRGVTRWQLSHYERSLTNNIDIFVHRHPVPGRRSNLRISSSDRVLPQCLEWNQAG